MPIQMIVMMCKARSNRPKNPARSGLRDAPNNSTIAAEVIPHESHEDFVKHHHAKYGGTLPVWAAVELLDWGGLTRLFGFAPRGAQDKVAAAFGLTAPQMESWLKSLNIVRNVSAHHGRLFNRVFAIAPKLPIPGKYPDLDAGGPFTRTFGQLSMIQHLLKAQAIGNERLLPAVVRTYPNVPTLPISHLGAPENWSQSQLWAS